MVRGPWTPVASHNNRGQSVSGPGVTQARRHASPQHPTDTLTHTVCSKFKVLVDLQTSESTSKLARKINNLFNLSDLP